MSCPTCGSPFPLSHFGDCRDATSYAPVPDKRDKAHPKEVQLEMCSNCNHPTMLRGDCIRCGHSLKVGGSLPSQGTKP